MEAQPLELVIGNIVRRVLFIIRVAHAAKLREMQSSQGQGSEAGDGDGGLPPQQPSLSLSDEGASAEEQLGVAVPNLRTTVMDAIGDLRCEVRWRWQRLWLWLVASVVRWMPGAGVCAGGWLMDRRERRLTTDNLINCMHLHMQLDDACGEISMLALEHIHANEVILTVGRSRTIEKFLKVRSVHCLCVISESAGCVAPRSLLLPMPHNNIPN